ncbi:TadE/TadG family type IV pilus assembly protein [Pseudoduganella violacea]|uniref:Flp pilus assembly protein TadG n=1 Tax=Pseudoduganella violacea TaxID=1715466 RepID=A0A7W5BDX5_9BURK|nr:TadE/TadG family type IV pilus assembly protein [Pseudoduganella violacea]MBB3121359.1 Flp pilus assembly protein TadG [Pseudoduganella violacea]
MNKTFASRRQQGAAAVEFGIVLTLLMTLLAGTFELGRAFWYFDALTKATRDGARTLSVAPTATISSQGVAAAKAIVVNAAASAGVPSFSSANVTVTCLTSAYADGTCTDGTAPGGVRVEIVSYQVKIGELIPFMIGSASRNVTLTPRTTMRYML